MLAQVAISIGFVVLIFVVVFVCNLSTFFRGNTRKKVVAAGVTVAVLIVFGILW